MAEVANEVRTVLDPEDEYCHEPDAAVNYNESMYANAFDFARGFGGWFRLGNRVNEGYAEMSCCLYLPDRRVGFMFARPAIESNEALDAGGLRFVVVEPLKALRVTYQGKLCLLADPLEMADPSRAFRANPIVPCRIELDYTGIAPVYGGRPVRGDGAEPERAPEQSFARAHYEQHVAARGVFEVDGERLPLSGYGLRDKSWGPRYWQAIHWYRWLPMCFGPDFGMVISLIASEPGALRPGGMVLVDGAYVPIREARLETRWDGHGHPRRVHATARTDEREYRVDGRVQSLIPLRNRRRGEDGREQTTRIAEGMTEFRCDGRVGYGMAEYLDQIQDGRPVGMDAEGMDAETDAGAHRA